MNMESIAGIGQVQAPSSLPHSGPSAQPALAASALVAILRELDDVALYQDVDLSHFSRWKIGGKADCVACPSSTAALIQVLKVARAFEVPVCVIGLTTNLLFSQAGVRALVIHLGNQFADFAVDGTRVWGQAGVWVPGYARAVARTGLTGIEHLAGIPGTLGGLICMNGGSQRKGIGDHLLSVTTVDLEGNRHVYDRAACGFAYRTSIFQANRQIITEAEFIYERAADTRQVRQEMKRILEDRRRKFPQKLPNCGSVFVSNPAMYADYGPPGAVIERCGLKGLVQGDAEVSSLHANFIVNRGQATAEDVLYLIDLIRTRVQQETGYDMQAEAKYVDDWGNFMPAHLVAREMFGGDHRPG